MKFRININEIDLEKSKKPLNEIIGIVGKPFTGARQAARLRRLKRIYDGPVEASLGDDFLAFTRGSRVRPNPAAAIEDIMKRVSAGKKEEILKALRDSAETGQSHVIKVGENPDLFIATARTPEGPRIVGRARGDGADVKLASEIDSTFGGARFLENPISINDLPSATIVSRGGPLDVDDYDILATRFEQLKSDGVLSDIDYDDLVRRIEVRRDAPRRSLSNRDVEDLDSVDELEQLRNTIDQRVEAGVYAADDVEEIRLAIDNRIPELNLSSAEAEAFLNAQRAREQLLDAGVEVDKIAGLQTTDEVDEALNALFNFRDDLPPDEAANLEALLNARRSQIEAGDDLVTPRDVPAPARDSTIDDWPIREYESKAAAQAAAEAIKTTDVGYPLLKEMKKIGSDFRYLPENAPSYMEGGKRMVYIVTDKGNLEPIEELVARGYVKQLKKSNSQLKDGFSVPLSKFQTYLDEVGDFAIPKIPGSSTGGKIGTSLRLLEGFVNLFLVPGNTIFSPAIATAMRRYGATKSQVFWTKGVLFYGYMSFAVVSLAGAMAAKYDELKQKREVLKQDTETTDSVVEMFVEMLGLVAKNETVGEYLNLLDEDLVDRAIKNGEIAQEMINELRKINTEKPAVSQAAEGIKGFFDAIPRSFAKYGVAIPIKVAVKYWIGGDFGVRRTYDADDAKKGIKKVRAKKEKIEVASGVAEEKMEELQFEIDGMGVDKKEWKAFSRGRSKTAPELTVATMINNYFDAHLEEKWNSMSPAEKIGHKKLIDKYIDWAETIGDRKLLAKARDLPMPASVGTTNRPEETTKKEESIIALPTLGNLRVRIKK